MGDDLFFSTIRRLRPMLRAGDLQACESGAIAALRGLPPSPFHLAADLSISNAPGDMAAHIDRFFAEESSAFGVRAVYVEMNGFDINPDRWYCDLFAYEEDGGQKNYDWLSDWQSEYFEDYTITGLEPLQAVYTSEDLEDEQYADAAPLAGLVVVTKFQRFTQTAACKLKHMKVPLYVSAHDYDYIARITKPKNTRSEQTPKRPPKRSR